jgi:hypothetical protein
MAEFPSHDHYYLLLWTADLKHRFPFLASSEIDHPYQLFYLVWKLSFWFGVQYSHHSLSFESLVGDSEATLSRLLKITGIEADISRLRRLITPTPRRWPGYASDEWFADHERWGDEILHDFFGAESIRHGQLETVLT